MADAVARLRYAGDRRPVTVKQTTWEEPGAHPEHVEGDGRAGGTTESRVDGHSDHSGAIFDDGDAPVAAVDKTVKQPSTQHHGNDALTSDNLPPVRSPAKAKALTHSPHHPASIEGTSLSNYSEDRDRRRPWWTRLHGGATPTTGDR